MGKRQTLTREYFRRQGARGGKLGAQARHEKLTPEQRSEIARRAVMARWARYRAAQAQAKGEAEAYGKPRKGK